MEPRPRKDIIDEMLEGASHPQKNLLPADPRIPTTIPISSWALEKAGTICSLVEEIYDYKYEWYGLLVSKKDSPVAHDILLGKQTCTGGHCQIEGEEIARLVDHQVPADSRIVGWIHSHGVNGLFFSGTDTSNMEKLINSVYHNTEIQQRQPLILIEGKPKFNFSEDKTRIVQSGQHPTDAEVHIPFSNEDYQTLLKLYKNESILHKKILTWFSIQVSQPALVGWSYSIVVNGTLDDNKRLRSQGMITYRQYLPLSEKSNVWSADMNVQASPDDGFPREWGSKETLTRKLRDEVREKIKIEGYSWTKKPVQFIRRTIWGDEEPRRRDHHTYAHPTSLPQPPAATPAQLSPAVPESLDLPLGEGALIEQAEQPHEEPATYAISPVEVARLLEMVAPYVNGMLPYPLERRRSYLYTPSGPVPALTDRDTVTKLLEEICTAIEQEIPRSRPHRREMRDVRRKTCWEYLERALVQSHPHMRREYQLTAQGIASYAAKNPDFAQRVKGFIDGIQTPAPAAATSSPCEETPALHCPEVSPPYGDRKV